jgi:hypothetical protein
MMLTVFCNLECQVTLFASLKVYIFSVMTHNGKTHKLEVNSKSISISFPVALFSWRNRYLAMLVHQHLSISAAVRHLFITPLHGTVSWHDSESPILSNLVPSVVKWAQLSLCLGFRILKQSFCPELEKTMTSFLIPVTLSVQGITERCRSSQDSEGVYWLITALS